MTRITKAMLEHQVKLINDITSSPTEQYTQDADGKYIANIGNYHLSWAYGGVCLEQMVSTGGGVRSIVSGYGTKRELLDRMQAFILGLGAAK